MEWGEVEIDLEMMVGGSDSSHAKYLRMILVCVLDAVLFGPAPGDS